jgi:hypothetical protein
MTSLTTEQLTHNLRDDTEGLYGFRWNHYDVVSEARSNEALAAINATDFRIRAAHQRRELLLEEVMHRIVIYMPDSPITGREGGSVWKEYQIWLKDHPEGESDDFDARGETRNS